MSGRMPYCGRDAEIVTLSDQFDRVCAGFGAVVLVEGEAGIGKSRLLEEAAMSAHRRGFRVGSSAADPGDSIVELATLLVALFEGVTPVLDKALLGGSPAVAEQRYWMLRDIEAWLERAARVAPLLICLDDLQWADSGTAAALRALPLRLAAAPIAWLLASRPRVGSGLIGGVLEHLGHRGAERLVLGPLDEAAVRRLTARMLEAEPDDDVLTLAGRAGGNPFYLAEMLLGLTEDHLVRIESGRAELIEPRLPQRVGETMRRRLDRMSESARQVAAVATGLGRSFTFDDLAAMLDRPPSALLGAVDELLGAGLFLESNEKLTFRHDLILEAVRASLPLSVSRALDRQAATVLMARGALPLEVATRLAAGAAAGDDVAITTLSKAATALSATDPGAAADFSERALALASRDHPLRSSLVAQTAIWLHAAGRGERAKAFADIVLRLALPPEEEAGIWLIIATMFAISPEVRGAACRKALALPNLSTCIRSLLLANLFHNLVTSGRVDEARAVLPETKDVVAAIPDHVCGQFVVELAESGLMYAEGRYLQALELAERARRSGRIAVDEPGLSPEYMRILLARRQLTTQWLCETLSIVDRLDESLQLLVESEAEAERERQAWALHLYKAERGRQLLRMGRVPEARAVLGQLFTPDIASQVVNVLDAAGVVALGRTAIHTGDRFLARQVTDMAQIMLNQDAPSVRRHAAWYLALQNMADGDPRRARQCLCSLGEHQRMSILPLFPMEITDEIELLRIALAVGDNELLQHVADAVQRRSAQNREVRSLQAVAAHTTGLVNRSWRDLADAARLYDNGGRPLALASALEDLGNVATQVGGTQDGIEAFNRALAIYAGAGATWDAGRIRARLRSLGVRRRLVSARRVESGWKALTDSELAVARLVAQGLSNREVAERLFVSPHTVGAHLRHVFTKLSVSSRVELARVTAGHEPDH